ncbi:hypothetical protein A2714_02045 [Candidatus Woesebacteria bacterium RIFCSPHIGHO2_01_FULL_38_9]|uniref:Uncharacterized protein n=1 Tax=Candidatus Woesebacteria bacterium RIFCSPHIGHO2_01_FULL_38_9 TaxID=1802492 RepID=A0A1F7Y1P5_9BACT|nr:MAG: hypothetical protein A2714_02045 [Candidatus Woesebacteria bacterium RIFCSPHIGHO2_01_FULL_38_9]
MPTKYFCDICEHLVENPIRVDWRAMYCEKCWIDNKNWSKIHEIESKKMGIQYKHKRIQNNKSS